MSESEVRFASSSQTPTRVGIIRLLTPIATFLFCHSLFFMCCFSKRLIFFQTWKLRERAFLFCLRRSRSFFGICGRGRKSVRNSATTFATSCRKLQHRCNTVQRVLLCVRVCGSVSVSLWLRVSVSPYSDNLMLEMGKCASRVPISTKLILQTARCKCARG